MVSNISIHAPTRGATSVRGFIFSWIIAFQSTLPREERRPCSEWFKTFSVFQSTLPREERLRHHHQSCNPVYFNPRSHERSDYINAIHNCNYFNFNPRSHERSDKRLRSSGVMSFNFNPRSHERSDEFDIYCGTDYDISIHAPTRGATQATRIGLFISKFQSTLPREERPNRISASGFLLEFQSTLPREERHISNNQCIDKISNFNPRSHERSDSNIAQKICLFLYNTDNKYIIR